MNMSQTLAITSEQLGGMSNAQRDAMFLSTPLVLDLNGNGIETLKAASGVLFDLNGTGNAQQWGWVGGGDGLLALDRNGDGIINNGSELFGSGFLMADGKRAADGFAALASLDSNHDHKINASDAQFNQLRVWVDANHDGKTDAGELKSLADLGIVEFGLDISKTHELNNGNVVGLLSSYTTADGVVHQIGDVWFAKNKDGTPASDVKLGDLLAQPEAPLLGGHAAGATPAAQPSTTTPELLHHRLKPISDDDENKFPLI
jgi:hypothetical protein